MAKKRLIDANALDKAILRYADNKHSYGNIEEACNILKSRQIIHAAPTVDAVEVVRCKDCLNCGMKAAIKYDGYRDDVRLCMLHGIPVLPDDYCSGGVKMDAEVE